MKLRLIARRIDVSHNCGGSKTVFLGCFAGFCDPKSRFFDRKPLIRLPYLLLLSRVMSIALDSTIGASGDTFTTFRDTFTTLGDILTTLRDTFTTLGDTSTHVEKVDLRRIASDFLTARIRMGESTKAHGRPSVGSSQLVKADVAVYPARETRDDVSMWGTFFYVPFSKRARKKRAPRNRDFRRMCYLNLRAYAFNMPTLFA